MHPELTPIWISLKTACLATVLAFFAGIVVARLMLAYRGKFRGVLDGVLTLPLVLPPVVVGFGLLVIFGKNSPLGQVLNQLGVRVIFTWSATVIAATVVAFPLMYKTVLSAFEQVEPTLVSCARTLGASEGRIFWLVLLPLAWPGVVAGTILTFARALGEFGATLLVSGNIEGVTQTMPIALYFAAEGGRMGVALGWVVLMVGISLGAIAFIHQGHQSHRFIPHNTLTRRGLNWLFFGTATPKVGNSVPSSPVIPRKPGSALAVDIEREVPGFRLQAAFQTGKEALGLLGGSGSGKTMILRCIAGLDTPTQGEIVLNGRVLFSSRRGINLPSRDRKVGLVFQNYALFPHLTVAQNIAFGLQHLPKPARFEQVTRYLDMMQLGGLAHRYPMQLSGGQQQRVALARALAIQPDILLFDEPLSALDTYLRSFIEKLLIEVLGSYEGVTLFITHKLEEAYRVCENLLVIGEGQILAAGTKEEIFERPPTTQVAKVTECKNITVARRLEQKFVEVPAWGCRLKVIEPIPEPLNYIGIRAHHVRFARSSEEVNIVPSWLAMISETQHRVTLYVKLNSPPQSSQDYHLQVEVYREKWEQLKDVAFPWRVFLDPFRLILMAR
ncbi:molybdate ABC transporter permease subunit [Spirulina sp. CS-785/01]|uniref:molybdate ABC transporter permease subunit n=1 Tax=Spirulina sp. CS-785/01 TaxID=3021716 RepID=UPI00232D4806|nr:molybdate ABC transporter permease subunit [Spirulina sp. CS-785/01]MDB9311713.1 molybdate ABC transporter permease subunit [Spirulina sp. CS-785/01]